MQFFYYLTQWCSLARAVIKEEQTRIEYINATRSITVTSVAPCVIIKNVITHVIIENMVKINQNGNFNPSIDKCVRFDDIKLSNIIVTYEGLDHGDEDWERPIPLYKVKLKLNNVKCEFITPDVSWCCYDRLLHVHQDELKEDLIFNIAYSNKFINHQRNKKYETGKFFKLCKRFKEQLELTRWSL